MRNLSGIYQAGEATLAQQAGQTRLKNWLHTINDGIFAMCRDDAERIIIERERPSVIY